MLSIRRTKLVSLRLIIHLSVSQNTNVNLEKVQTYPFLHRIEGQIKFISFY